MSYILWHPCTYTKKDVFVEYENRIKVVHTYMDVLVMRSVV